MSMQQVVDRILSDANAEAAAIVAAAEEKAAKLLAETSARTEAARRETEREVSAKAESVLEKRAADARLESAKILLAEKRATVDKVYTLALQRLLALDKEACLALAANVLNAYAEDGDEVLFAENFRYAAEVERLPVSQTKHLRFSKERLAIDGGMRLIGKISDKDLSYGALLEADRDEQQAALAKAIFK